MKHFVCFISEYFYFGGSVRSFVCLFVCLVSDNSQLYIKGGVGGAGGGGYGDGDVVGVGKPTANFKFTH